MSIRLFIGTVSSKQYSSTSQQQQQYYSKPFGSYCVRSDQQNAKCDIPIRSSIGRVRRSTAVHEIVLDIGYRIESFHPSKYRIFDIGISSVWFALPSPGIPVFYMLTLNECFDEHDISTIEIESGAVYFVHH